MRLVYPYVDKEPNMVLIEGIRGAKSRMTVDPPLIVYEKDGSYTREILEYYVNDRNWKGVTNGRNIIFVCNTDRQSGRYDVPGDPDAERS